MKIADENIINLISSSALNNVDCFITPDSSPTANELLTAAEAIDGKIAIIIPGKLSLSGIFSSVDDDYGTKEEFNKKVSFCPSNFLSAPEMWHEFDKNNINHFMITSAELIKRTEYGFSRDLKRFCDLRASVRNHINLTAIFSCAAFLNEEKTVSLFGGNEAIAVGSFMPKLNGLKSRDFNAKLMFVENRLKMISRGAVICSTRREAEIVSDFLRRKNIQNILFHGGIDDRKKKQSLIYLSEGEPIHIVATKSIFKFAPFLPDYDVLCFGLPYSVSHAARILSLTHGKSDTLDCIFTPDDISLMQRLNIGYAKESCPEHADLFAAYRAKALAEVIRLIIG